MAAPKVSVYTTPPEILVDVLRRSHPLVSLPLVRRLRFAAAFPGGITEHARILWSSRVSLEEYHTLRDGGIGKGAEEEEEEEGKRGDESGGTLVKGECEKEEPLPAFAAAYLDFSRGPETELWIYSSMEARLLGSGDGTSSSGISTTITIPQDDASNSSNINNTNANTNTDTDTDTEREREEIACAVCLFRQVKHEQDQYYIPGSPRTLAREFPTLLVGNLNEVLRERLVAPGGGGGGGGGGVELDLVSTGLYDKWIFEVGELPAVALPGDGDGRRWVWDVVRREDIPFTISRTKIQRRERTMKLLPSTALYLDDGTPVAWAFLGPDSSLSSLHCEEPYRGRGIAKAVAIKLLRDHLGDYNDDAYYGWADVAPDNVQSQGVCKSLNGKPRWQISWSRLNLDTSFPEA